MADSQDNFYDAVPYPDKSFAFSHPRRLETMATLFGMDPVPITGARVLELGCAAGGNLIPQAVDLPEASFLGVDLSQRQIGEGRRTIEALGLDNIELRRADILAVDDDWGQFDYIICHGVLSWVPPKVREKIFEICGRNLSPSGVALVSYNAYPGWHLVQVIRDMMRYHISEIEEPAKQISQAIAAMQFVAKWGDAKRLAVKLFEEESQLLKRNIPAAYLYHDHLEPHNHPYYFHEFMERAEAVGLQYLSEENVAQMLLDNCSQEVTDALRPLSLIQQEQYMDFLRGRRFRQTLLCHKEISLNRSLRSDQMMCFHVSLRTLPDPVEVDIRNDEPSKFKSKDYTMSIKKRVVKAAIMHLREIYPNYVHFSELHEEAVNRLRLARDDDRYDELTDPRALSTDLMIGLCRDVFKICVHPPRCVTRLSARPMVGRLSRVQASMGRSVTNQFHVPVDLDEFGRQIIRRLDGRHDRKALAESMQEAVASGRIRVDNAEKAGPAALSNAVDEALSRICSLSLLVG